jgi:ADP-ribosylglycohydrolase
MYNPDFLLRIGCADAAGAALEFVDSARHRDLVRSVLRLTGYHGHPRHTDHRPGSYTDDTQMSIAVTEVLLGWDHSSLAFAEGFVAAFQRDPRRGYASGFYNFLCTIRDGSDFLERIKPVSEKIGGGMRAVPLGVIGDPGLLLAISDTQCSTTHGTDIGRFASAVVALMSHWAIYHSLSQHSIADCFDFVEAHLGPRAGLWSCIERGTGPGAVGIICSAFNALLGAHTLTEVLRRSISYGGDTDSIAAIAVGIGAHCAFIVDDFPEWMSADLELGGGWGRVFLTELGRRLGDKYKL